jgi:hypothetical protein
MNDIKTKGHFTYAVIQGLGGNFNLDMRAKLASYVLNLAQERPANPKDLLSNFFDPVKGNWNVFAPDI